MATRRKIGKIREVKTDLSNYSYLINGVAGVGKTTTVTEIGQKEFGVNGYLLLTVGQEPEPVHIGNVWNERAKDWDDLVDIIDTICTYKNEDYSELKMIGIDSVDEVFRLAEEKVIELHNQKVTKITDKISSIKSAFGGYQAGENKVINMVSDKVFKLRDYGISLFFIGHTKQKNKKDQMLDIEFEQITSNLDNKYYNCIKDKVNIVMCAYVERELTDLETRKDAFSKKDKQVGKIASEKRVVSFRDEEYAIDVKSHLKYIIPKCDLDSDIMIKELKTAIKKEAERFTGKDISDQELEKRQLEDRQELNKKAEESLRKDNDSLGAKEEKLTKIKENMSKLDLTKLQGIIASHGVTSLGDASSIPTECLDEILALL